MLMLMLYTQLVRLCKGHMHVPDPSVGPDRIVVVSHVLGVFHNNIGVG